MDLWCFLNKYLQFSVVVNSGIKDNKERKRKYYEVTPNHHYNEYLAKAGRMKVGKVAKSKGLQRWSIEWRTRMRVSPGAVRAVRHGRASSWWSPAHRTGAIGSSAVVSRRSARTHVLTHR